MNRLSVHFRPPSDDVRVGRVWVALDRRLARRERRRAQVRAASWAALSCLALGLCFAGLRALRAAGAEHADPHVIELADGSRVEHAARDPIAIEVVTPERVELRMSRGRAYFRVAPNRARAFITHAAGYTIRVLGTEYSVELAQAGVQVEVTRGEVEVRRDDSDKVWRVRTHERWSSNMPGQRPPEAGADAASVAPPVAPQRAAASEPAHEGARTTHRVEPARVSASAAAARDERQDAQAALLFLRAQRARLQGDRARTMQLLAAFVERYPEDSRAGLAAFQLGRLRLERGDARGALAAFAHAERVDDAFQEQLQARRVQALEALGALSDCRSARAAFLRAFEHSAFAEVVRHRCQ